MPGAPVVSVSSAADLIGRSFQATNEAMTRLEAAGIVRQVNVGRRNRAFEAPAIIDPSRRWRGSSPARRARKGAGLTVLGAAEATEYGNYVRWEAGTTRVGAQHLGAIVEALGIATPDVPLRLAGRPLLTDSEAERGRSGARELRQDLPAAAALDRRPRRRGQ
ncbi:MAG: hypothetical protein M3378_02655 [Actinomycetota bacterium]|nr:hypothetical protein [Actinomycetota bacterium]